MGPNVKRLIVERMSTIIVSKGHKLHQVIGQLSDAKNIQNVAKEATVWTQNAIKILRDTTGIDQSWDDEKIAGEILARLDRRKKLLP